MMKMKKDKKQISETQKNTQEQKYNIENGRLGLLDLITPDAFIEEKDTVYTNPNNISRTYGILVYPRNLYVGFFNDFFQIGTINISTYIENIPERTVANYLIEEITKLKSNAILSKVEDFALMETIEDLTYLLKAIQTNKDKAFYTQVLITIYAKNKEELEEKCEEFEDICARKGIKPLSLIYDQKEGFITALPYMNLKYLELTRNITTGGVACMIPTGNTELSHSKGIYIGDNLLTGSPIFYDVFIGPPQLVNPHMMVFGIAGAGKTVTMKTMILRQVAMGRLVVILDPEGEYKELVEYVGGQYINIKAGEKTGINPFELEITENEKGEKELDIQGKVSEIRELISTFIEKFRPSRQLEGAEITVLEESVKNLYNQRGINKDPNSLYEERTEEEGKYHVGKIKKELPTLNDLREELSKNEYTKELAELLKIITGEGSMSLFDCQTKIDINKKIIAFNLKNISDEFLKFFSTINILSWIWGKLSNWKMKNIYKSVMIDEGWLFTKYQHSVKYLEEISRRGRKYKISLTIASQQMEEFIGNESGRAILNMCATKFLMKQEPQVAKEISEYFKISGQCADIMSRFSEGQALLLSERDIVMLQVKPFDFEWKYVTIQYEQ